MRKIILTATFALVLLAGPVCRLSISGWFFLIGILSIFVFGLIHIILHNFLIRHAQNLRHRDIGLVAMSHLSYLGLFLFQSDGGDDRGYVVIEYLFGKFNFTDLESYNGTFFLSALILYFLVLFLLLSGLRQTTTAFTKKQFRSVSLLILFILIAPAVFLYFRSSADQRREEREDEHLGKYENLRRALRNRDHVRYLRLYEYPKAYTTIPEDVFKLHNLEELELYSNAITGISPGISSLKKLKTLDLQYNQIRTLPDELFAMPRLEELILLNNVIDSVSERICECKSLKKLYIGGPSLKAIPSCLAAMPNLEKLVIQSDSINNYMDIFSAFKTLKELDLYTYGHSIRDNKKYIRLKQALPNTKIDIPSVILNAQENKNEN